MAHLSNPQLQDAKSLWVGDIETWMDESYLANIFATTGAVSNVKVIRDKKTGFSLGYGFVEFANHRAAQEVLMKFNGTTIPGTNKKLKMNWGVMAASNKTAGAIASTGTGTGTTLNANVPTKAGPTQPTQEHSIYVGELSSNVDENVLVEFFSQRYRTITGAKIIIDPVTRQSKGYGFVKFSSAEEAQSAIREMQGTLLRGRAIKTNQAHLKSSGSNETTTLNASNLMLNPLIASLATNTMPTTGYMMGTDPSALSGYATQGFQGQPIQGLQGGFLGMAGMPVMQTQGFVNTGYTYPNMTNMTNMSFQNPQAFQQPQMIYGQQGTMISGYATQGFQMAPQQANLYQPQVTQVGGFYPQQATYQQYPGFMVQPQISPTQQQFPMVQPNTFQQFPQNNQSLPQQKQQSPLLPTTPQNQKKPPLISTSSLKAQQSTPKGFDDWNQDRVVNTLLPSSKNGDIFSSLFSEMELIPSNNKIEEEKPQDSMIYNPNYIETNFKFDFIIGGKMEKIL